MDHSEISKVQASGAASERERFSQSDLPTFTLERAIVVPRSLWDDFGGKATPPLLVAQALDVSPTSSNWRYLPGSAVGYGLTNGSYKADAISLTELGRKAVGPTKEDEDVEALKEAAFLPTLARRFYEQYLDRKWPAKAIGMNVLATYGVPADRRSQAFDLLEANAKFAGLFLETKGGVFLSRSSGASVRNVRHDVPYQDEMSDETEVGLGDPAAQPGKSHTDPTPISLPKNENRKVFITHGKNRSLVDLLKKFLVYAEMEPVVLVEKETVSQPVPEKVMEAMRSCGAAVIHVDADQKLVDAGGRETLVLNPNVLIEIGAAMALYGRRFILLVKDGITLPSNLQGLYEVRYEGDNLEATAVMKLLEALSDLKKRPLPTG